MMMKTVTSSLAIIAAGSVLAITNSNAAITYSSAAFSNLTTIQDDALGEEHTADVTVGGVVAGLATLKVVYGGGTHPFNNVGQSAAASFAANGISTQDAETMETADGVWTFTIAPAAGYVVDGISLYTNGTSIANPVYAGITTDGVATIQDDNQGLVNELIGNFDDGDAIASGSDIEFTAGTSGPGITSVNHTELWSYDSAGATSISFTYEAGYNIASTNISNESIRFDAQLTEAPPVPEPSAGLLAAFGGLLLLRRRRK